MKSIIQNALLLTIALCASLLTAEFVVSIVSPQNLSGTWRVATESGLLVNKSHGSARHQFGDRIVTYAFTPPHLRGSNKRGSMKVLVIGDSYTFGWLLDNQSHYVNLLQQYIDSDFGPSTFTLLNAAAGGWGTGDQVAYVEEFGDEINPDMILVFLNTDDIGRALRSPLWEYDVASAELTRKHATHSKLKRFLNDVPGYKWLLENSHLMQLARVAALRPSEVSHPIDTLSELPEPVKYGPQSNTDEKTALIGKALGESLFSRLASWCKSKNVYLAVTTTGWFQPPYTNSAPAEAFMIGAEDFFRGLGVPFFDPSTQIWSRRKESLNAFFIPKDGHPNEAGAALIAEHVYPFVSNQLDHLCHVTNRCMMRGNEHL